MQFQDIKIGETFFTEDNPTERLIKATLTTAFNARSVRVELAKHIGVIPEVTCVASQAEEDVLALLAYHTGTESYHRSNPAISWFFHTDGVHDLAQTAQCFWLIDIILSWQMHKHIRRESFQAWTLEKRLVLLRPEDMAKNPRVEWIVRCTDGGAEGVERDLARQYIPYADFPLDSITLWVEEGADPDGNPCKVLLLPGEH